VRNLQVIYPQLPPHYRVLLAHPLQSLDDLDRALSVPVDAVIVDEDLLKSGRTQHLVKEHLARAEADRA
jgi:hypothetical protein